MRTEKEILNIRKSLSKDADKITYIFQALSDRTRLKIFRLFTKEEGLCVTDISNILEVSVPAVSHQLKVMEMVGLMERERKGKMICYKIRRQDPVVERILEITQQDRST